MKQFRWSRAPSTNLGTEHLSRPSNSFWFLSFRGLFLGHLLDFCHISSFSYRLPWAQGLRSFTPLKLPKASYPTSQVIEIQVTTQIQQFSTKVEDVLIQVSSKLNYNYQRRWLLRWLLSKNPTTPTPPQCNRYTYICNPTPLNKYIYNKTEHHQWPSHSRCSWYPQSSRQVEYHLPTPWYSYSTGSQNDHYH